MSKEYIEKEAAIDYLTLNMNWYDEDGGQVDDWDERKAIISDLLDGIPPAEVKPVFRGEWVIEETVEIGGIWVNWVTTLNWSAVHEAFNASDWKNTAEYAVKVSHWCTLEELNLPELDEDEEDEK